MILTKHLKYKDYYISNDRFWGLGIEHETYLCIDELRVVSVNDMVTKINRERYSVNYFQSYKNDEYKNAILDIFTDRTQLIKIPILLNAYGLQRCDYNGNHETTYSKIPRKNIAFEKSIWNDLCEKDSWFIKNNEKTFIFDGDTLEFVTCKFYKATIKNVIDEYTTIKRKWLKHFKRIFEKVNTTSGYKKINLATINYPFASYTTNPTNVALFNNGTLHINITLPTKLNATAEIENLDTFTNQHRVLARILQWVEPLWAAIYGTPDPLSASSKYGGRFSKSSQRCAVSRYIGIGTYDTNTMPKGKILQIDGDKKYSWIPSQASGSDTSNDNNNGYSYQDKIGLDINFNKHYNHGLELRFFDQMSLMCLKQVLDVVIYLADLSLTHTTFPNPVESEIWKAVTKKILMLGKDYLLTKDEYTIWISIFGLDISLCKGQSMTVQELYNLLVTLLPKLPSVKNGICSKVFN